MSDNESETEQAFKESVQAHDEQTHATLAGLMGDEPILRWFAFDHLPRPSRGVSRPFAELALRIGRTLPRSAERTVALRKLLESKDAAVRAGILAATLTLLAVGCVCELEPAPNSPGFCERLELVACENAQCDAAGEPMAERCDLAQVEECVAAIEASPSCWEAGGIAASELCRTACRSSSSAGDDPPGIEAIPQGSVSDGGA